ncbi:OTU domain-containing protein [Tanacetum coccineum]
MDVICDQDSAALFSHLDEKIEPQNEFDRLDQRLKFYGFRYEAVIGDGNCVTRSISDQVYGNEELHPLVRTTAIAMIKRHRHLYRQHFQSNESFSRYCYNMSRTGTWADGLLTKAASDAYGVKIVELVSNLEYCIAEFVPYTEHFKKEIYLCSSSKHTDSMYRAGELTEKERRRIKRYGYFTSSTDFTKMNKHRRFV